MLQRNRLHLPESRRINLIRLVLQGGRPSRGRPVSVAHQGDKSGLWEFVLELTYVKDVPMAIQDHMRQLAA